MHQPLGQFKPLAVSVLFVFACGCGTGIGPHAGFIAGGLVGSAIGPVFSPIGAAAGMHLGTAIENMIMNSPGVKKKLEEQERERKAMEQSQLYDQLAADVNSSERSPAEAVAVRGRVWVDEAWRGGKIVEGHFETRGLAESHSQPL